MIYLDYAADTPVNTEVLENFCDISKEHFANPNAVHGLGVSASKLIENATNKIKSILPIHMDAEIIYTSGATESNNMAIKGIASRYRSRGKHIISSPLEHMSVLGPLEYLKEEGYEIDYLRMLPNGQIDIANLKDIVREDTILVSIGYVDGEIGILQPIEEIAEITKNYKNCFFHSDATQAVGKIDVNFENIDLVSFSPHKFYGLKGIGMLIKNNKARIENLIHGGNSTTPYRSGTPVTGMITSSAKALEISSENLADSYKYVKAINEKVQKFLKNYSQVKINSTENSIPHILNFSIEGIKSPVFAKKLDEKEICISTKSSCCNVNTLSRAVYALTGDKKTAQGSIRLSFSHLTAEHELNTFFKCFDACIKQF